MSFFPSYIQITISLHNNNSTFSHASILWSCKAMERAHVTSKFVHLVCKVNIVGLTPISKWKNVLKKEKYDECIKKARKTWYYLIVHAMTNFLFQLKLLISSFIS